MWVKVIDGVEVRCVKSSNANKPFKYEMKINDETLVIDSSNNSPTEMTYRSELYAEVKKHLLDYSSDKQKELFRYYKNKKEYVDGVNYAKDCHVIWLEDGEYKLSDKNKEK